MLVATQKCELSCMLSVLDLGIIEWGILGVPLNEHGYQTCGSIWGRRRVSELLTLCSIGQVVMYKTLLLVINRKNGSLP